MYDRIPTLLTPDELLDKVLGKAAKIQKADPEYFYRIKKTTISKLESTMDNVVETLEKWVKAFPNLEKLTTYERELIDLVIGIRPLQRALSRLDGATDTVRRLFRDGLEEAKRARTHEPLFEIHRRLVGRMSSVVKDLTGPLAFLAEARAIFKTIPEVTPGDATIVVAGYPNVGKSSLLARLTKARPDIAPYPFTTKQSNVGHFLWPEDAGFRARRYQLVDTPGILEKLPKDRTKIERHATLALAYLADLILYVMDPSESSGYLLADQEALRDSLRKEFAGIPMILVSTKSDLKGGAPGVLSVSATTGAGLDELKKQIVANVPLDPYEGLLPGASQSEGDGRRKP